MSAAVDELVGRLRSVERRLVEHAEAEDRGLPAGLTAPDPGGEERWEAGQVWAHVAEFPAYWLGQVRRVLAGGPDPVPFGRVKTDPGRLAAIERDRRTDPAALLARTRGELGEVADAIGRLSPADWIARGQHPARGEMSVQAIVERFIVAHLEEHADQLDELRAG